MRTLIAWCGTNAVVLHCLAHNRKTGQKCYATVPFYRKSCRLFLRWWELVLQEKKLKCAPGRRTSGPSELINGGSNKDSIHFLSSRLSPHFFFLWLSSAPASWWEGWNSHSGWTLHWLSAWLAAGREEGENRKSGGCWRPLVPNKTPSPDLTAEVHWLIDVTLLGWLQLQLLCCFFLAILSHWPFAGYLQHQEPPRDIRLDFHIFPIDTSLCLPPAGTPRRRHFASYWWKHIDPFSIKQNMPSAVCRR